MEQQIILGTSETFTDVPGESSVLPREATGWLILTCAALWKMNVLSFQILTLKIWESRTLCPVGIIYSLQAKYPTRGLYIAHLFSNILFHAFSYGSVCEFEMGGPEGIVESLQIARDGKALQTEAVDCRWYIKAPPRSKVRWSSLATAYQRLTGWSAGQVAHLKLW